MKILFFLLSFLLVFEIHSQSCTVDFVGNASPDCISLKKPYCQRVNVPDQSSRYDCVECVNDCDCDPGQYCSVDVWNGKAGYCQNFKKAGSSCIPMDDTRKRNSKIENKWKCGDIIMKGGEIVGIDGPRVGGGPACIDSVCRACSPSALGGSSVVCQSGGMSKPRVCALPGTFVEANAYFWRSAEYGENPTWVWLAIYFPFMICGLCCLCILICKKNIPGLGRPFSLKSGWESIK